MTEHDRCPTRRPVIDLLMAFRRSQTMFAAVSLGVFDALLERPKIATELAVELHTDPDGPRSGCSTPASA